MRALTGDRPKCFLTLGGKTLLQRQLDALREGGIAEVAIVTGYRADAFTALGCTTFHNVRWSETNMVASLAVASSWLCEHDTIVSYSDIFYSPETVRDLAACEADIAMAYDPDWLSLWRLRFDDPASDAESFRIDARGDLVEIGAKRPLLDDVGGQYMGLLKFTPRGWDAAREDVSDRLDMTALLARLLARGVRIATVPVRGRWGEVDSERDLAIYEEMLEASRG
jgi:choline kinase